ncbi:MAG: hypothetical protein LV480_02995 [Methylacidiphilales bacterium]|nr:hypothetical protein [Candidatus Methylacidiphilales bacterium]
MPISSLLLALHAESLRWLSFSLFFAGAGVLDLVDLFGDGVGLNYRSSGVSSLRMSDKAHEVAVVESEDAKVEAFRSKLAAERAMRPPLVSKEDFMYARPNGEGFWCDGDGDPL